MARLRSAGRAWVAGLLLACACTNAWAWPAPRQRQQPANPRDIAVTGARVLDSGLLEPLPQRQDAPRPSGPVTLVGGVGGVDGVVVRPGEVRPQDRLGTPPEREYRLLSGAAKVYALPGQAVGFGYVLSGSPVGLPVPVEVVVSFPQDREDGPRQTESRVENRGERRTEHLEREAVLGRADWAAWDFAPDAPVEGGQYVIEVRCQGVELARRAFLVAPRAVTAKEATSDRLAR